MYLKITGNLIVRYVTHLTHDVTILQCDLAENQTQYQGQSGEVQNLHLVHREFAVSKLMLLHLINGD
jgi:hypothetical protein